MGEEGTNRTYEDKDVSNRHMTWWIRIDDGSSMRSAGGRRRVWREARRAAQEARDGDGVGKAQHQAEEAEEEENWRRRKRERQTRQCNESTSHRVLILLANATASATATAQKLR